MHVSRALCGKPAYTSPTEGRIRRGRQDQPALHADGDTGLRLSDARMEQTTRLAGSSTCYAFTRTIRGIQRITFPSSRTL